MKAALNPLPALTWNWLKMNAASLDQDFSFKRTDAALEHSRLPDGVSFEEAAEESEAFANIKGAMGGEFSSLLAESAAPVFVLKIAAGTKVQEPILFRARLESGAASFKKLLVEAGAGSEAKIVVEWESGGGDGLNAVQTKIRAEKGARVTAAFVQRLGSGFVHLNDFGAAGEDDSAIELFQIELGAKNIFTGAAASLDGRAARFAHAAAYFLDKERTLDMNLVASHFGKAATSEMNVYGTLDGKAKKTYRGTIDFKNGCRGSAGNESEETLLLSPACENRSIPLILCDEEDVQGEHGATIGRLDEGLLFYLKTRGISLEEARKMMARAKIARVAALIPDEGAAARAMDFFDEHF